MSGIRTGLGLGIGVLYCRIKFDAIMIWFYLLVLLGACQSQFGDLYV